MKNNNKFRWKRTATGVSIGLLLMCNSSIAQVSDDQNTFTLNLKNTDIQSLIATVSKQTGRNFVVDPRVKAKVTVISTDPVNADGLYEVFLSVLQVHGYSAVPAGDLVKIVPDVTAKQGPVPILGEEPDTSDQLVTQVITVVNVPAAQLVPILRPMVPQQGHLAAYAATNSLIITDRASNIQRLMEIIRRIDRPDNEEIEVVRLNHAAASEIVGTLSALQRNNIGGPQGPGAMQLVADERTNSVLISGDRAVRIRVRGLIAHLDTPIESSGNTQVVYLKFADAEDMVTILQGVSQGQARVGATAPDAAGGVQQNFTQQQPTAQQQGAAPNTVAQNNANRATAGSAAETGESNVDIQADPNTNALIITAPQDEMQAILAVIRQLDIRRAQVLVEAVIAEITEDNTREFGINFLIDGTDSNAPVGFTNLGGATDTALGIAASAAAAGGGLPPSSLGAGLSLALGRFATGDIDFGFLVRAIASDADNNILSTPSIVTLDNEEAEIVVGSNVPFVTGQQLSANNNNPFQTVEREDIGLTLKVKPQINDGNTIKMELEQEVSSVNTTALTGAADITTSKRSIKTTVLVDDGQTLVLGGLIDDQITDVEEKVPLLGDIPLLGNLFRYRTTTKTKQNLMIFLHPVILRDSDSAHQFSNSKYNSLRSRQLQNRLEEDSGVRTQQELPELKFYFDGKVIDNPITQYESPSFERPSDPLRAPLSLTDSSNGSTANRTIVQTSGGSLIDGSSQASASPAAASPAKADIEKVIAAYSAEQAEEVLAQNETPQQPAAQTPETTVAASATQASVTPDSVTQAPTETKDPVIAEVEKAPELPVANEALVASILQAEPEATEAEDIQTVDSQSTDVEPIEALPIEALEEPAAVVEATETTEPEATGTVVNTRGGTLITSATPESDDAPQAIASNSAESDVETVSFTETKRTETVIDARPEIKTTTGTLITGTTQVDVVDAPVTAEPVIAENDTTDSPQVLATNEAESEQDESEQIVAETETETVSVTAETNPDATIDELIDDKPVVAETELVVEQPVSKPILVSFEESPASQAEPEIQKEPEPKVLPLAETFEIPQAADQQDVTVAEVPASSKPVPAEAFAQSSAEDTDALVEDLADDGEDAVTAAFIDRLDSEFVDRSQDDLADDRPEVVILSISAGDQNLLPEMQSAPRY